MDDEYDALCLTITGYRRPGMSCDEYAKYMREVHAAICSGLMEKYGILEYTQTHSNQETRQMLRAFYGPDFGHLSDYDCVVQIVFRKLEDYIRMQQDPYSIEVIFPDHFKFADMNRTTMTIGKRRWFVKDSKALIKN
ncbi:EthD domain-containing protein [Halenospora varia]|nr:EthD domain-containing protein [Halenospora varia]